MPLDPAPPLTLVITTSTPAALLKAETKPLAIESVPPPALYGTIILIAFSGYAANAMLPRKVKKQNIPKIKILISSSFLLLFRSFLSY